MNEETDKADIECGWRSKMIQEGTAIKEIYFGQRWLT